MLLSDLRPGMENIVLKVKLVSLSDQREVTTYSGLKHEIVEGIIEDDSMSMGLTIWNEKIELVKELKIGDSIKLINCFVSSYQGELSVNIGRDSDILKR
jgi:replication factor A1